MRCAANNDMLDVSKTLSGLPSARRKSAQAKTPAPPIQACGEGGAGIQPAGRAQLASPIFIRRLPRTASSLPHFAMDVVPQALAGNSFRDSPPEATERDDNSFLCA